MRYSLGMNYWMSLVFYSYDNLEDSYKFSRFPTSIWSLVDVRKFLHYLYIFLGSTIHLMDLVDAFQQFTIWKLYSVNLYYINILKFRTYEWLYSVVHKYLLSSKLSLLYGALYKPSELVGLVKTTLTVC